MGTPGEDMLELLGRLREALAVLGSRCADIRARGLPEKQVLTALEAEHLFLTGLTKAALRRYVAGDEIASAHLEERLFGIELDLLLQNCRVAQPGPGSGTEFTGTGV